MIEDIRVCNVKGYLRLLELVMVEVIRVSNGRGYLNR